MPAQPDGIATEACGELLNEKCALTHACRCAESFFASFSASAFFEAISLYFAVACRRRSATSCCFSRTFATTACCAACSVSRFRSFADSTFLVFWTSLARSASFDATTFTYSNRSVRSENDEAPSRNSRSDAGPSMNMVRARSFSCATMAS